MSTAPSLQRQDVAYLAGQILNAHRSEPGVGLKRELDRAKQLLSTLRPRTTFERERLEVLQGALECLESRVAERQRAALHLLEQLAGDEAAPINRRTPPA
jgi:hypothetical protein